MIPFSERLIREDLTERYGLCVLQVHRVNTMPVKYIVYTPKEDLPIVHTMEKDFEDAVYMDGRFFHLLSYTYKSIPVEIRISKG